MSRIKKASIAFGLMVLLIMGSAGVAFAATESASIVAGTRSYTGSASAFGGFGTYATGSMSIACTNSSMPASYGGVMPRVFVGGSLSASTAWTYNSSAYSKGQYFGTTVKAYGNRGQYAYNAAYMAGYSGSSYVTTTVRTPNVTI